MEVFATRDFFRRAVKAGMTTESLLNAVRRIEKGSIDAQLGAGLIKQRVEIAGRGRSAGARVIVFWRREEFVLFLHMFLKNEKGNLTPHELNSTGRLHRCFPDWGRPSLPGVSLQVSGGSSSEQEQTIPQ